MSSLGEAIAAARERLDALMKSCEHPSTHPVCKEPGSAMACDDCGLVVLGGTLSATTYGEAI